MGLKIDFVYSALSDDKNLVKRRLGKEFWHFRGEKTFTIRVLDDDGNPMYRALVDDDDRGDDAAEVFLAWAGADVGATYSEILENGKWKPYMS